MTSPVHSATPSASSSSGTAPGDTTAGDTTADHAGAPGPGLRRSASDRVLGGVCGGIAAHLGVDAVVVRLLTVALTLVGGGGVVLYLAALVLMPAPDGGPAMVDRFLGRGSADAGVSASQRPASR